MQPSSLRLGTFSLGDAPPFVGLVRDHAVIALQALAPVLAARGQAFSEPASMLGLLQHWDHNLGLLQALSAQDLGRLEALPLTTLQVHAPVPHPRQIFCTGANYRKHVIDLMVDQGGGAATDGMSIDERRVWAAHFMDERAAHGEPYVFVKLPSCVQGPYAPLRLPADSKQIDWELELAVVIGKGGTDISRHDALSHVAGFTIANDVTCRDHVYRKDMKVLGTDWLMSKSRPGFLPMGPFLVARADVPHPDDLNLRLAVNGKVMQNESTADMVFGIARQIEYISHYAQLLPGDVICTGSPAGNGAHYGRYLLEGDVMEASITGLGEQRTRCVAA